LKSVYRNTLLLVLALLVGCAAVNYLPVTDPNGVQRKMFPVKQGLDLAGGTRAVLQLQTSPEVPVITPEVQAQVLGIMHNRINAIGISEPLVQAKGNDQIVIEMPLTPGASIEQQQKDLQDLIQAAKLEFIWLKDCHGVGEGAGGNPSGRYIYEGGNRIVDADTGKPLTDEEVQKKILYADPANIIVTGSDLKPNGAKVDIESGANGRGVVTHMEFNDKGAKKFADYTSANVGSLLAVVLNGQIQQAPRIQSKITDGTAIIEGGSSTTVKEAQKLADLFNAGALPVPLKSLASSSVEATLGQGAVQHAIVGGIIGIALVLVFMLAYYFLPGAIAAIALIIYAIITFSLFRLLGVVLTLPGIAGFILSVGMAVDANILIFERMKEEMRAGRTLHAAVDAGFDRAWTSIRDSNISTLITCLILYIFGTGPIRGFAFVLSLGVIVSLFTAITVSRALLHVLVNQEWSHDPKYFRVGEKQFGWGQKAERQHWDVMGKMNLWFTISAILILVGWGFNAAHYFKDGSLVRKGIDFTGGTMLTYSLPNGVTASDEDVKAVFAQNGLKESSVQRTVEQTGATAGKSVVTVRTIQLDPQKVASLFQAMQTRFGNEKTKQLVRQEAVDTVGPVISAELTRQAFMAIIFACLLIALYLGVMFGQFGFLDGLKYGSAAVIALFHDVLVIFGFMGLAGYLWNWEMSSLFVTAALTVIGFSVHDTIVVFDRIRENMKIHGKEMSFKDISNASIVQTLGRSINTSATVVITLAALLIFGTQGSLELKVFTAVLLVGIISGTYSSIFNATPIVVLMEKRRDAARLAAAAQTRRPSAADTKSFATPKAAVATPSTPKPAAADPVGDAEKAKAAGAAKKTKRRF
jgi:SecD/SecF fusion protein